ncbi:hypothetical protein QYF61_017807, partial [Mycteria americana]
MYKYLKRGCKEDTARFFSVDLRQWAQTETQKIALIIRKHFFNVSVTEHLHRLLREVVESPLSETFKSHPDTVLGNQATVPARSLLLHGLSTGCSFLQGTSTCSGMGSCMGYSVDICSIMVLLGLRGDNLRHCGLHHRLQGSLCSSAWSTSSSSFFTDLVLSWFSPSRQPSTTQPLAHLPPRDGMGERIERAK